MNKKMAVLLAIFGIVAALLIGIAGSPGTTSATENKVTLCHAAGLDGTTHYETLTIGFPAAFGPAGHFFENGTPRAGHEQDYLGACTDTGSTTTSTTTTTSTSTSTTTTPDSTTTTSSTTTVPNSSTSSSSTVPGSTTTAPNSTTTQPSQSTSTEVTTTTSPEETTTTIPALTVDFLNPVCDNDVPYLSYSASSGDATSVDSITFVNPGGDDFVYTNLPLSGRVLWPGAVVDSAGNPVDWPGWTETSPDVWVEGDEWNWVRPSVTIVIEINPSETFTVNYPPSSPQCQTDPPEPVDPPQRRVLRGSLPGTL